MLKSSGRTDEASVMGAEEWPQVIVLFNNKMMERRVQ